MPRPAFLLRSMCPAFLRLAGFAAGVSLLFGVAATVVRAEVLRAGGTGSAAEFIRPAGAAFTAREPGTIEPTLEDLERGAFPNGKDFYFVASARRTPATDRFLDFLLSSEERLVLREAGNLPVPR